MRRMSYRKRISFTTRRATPVAKRKRRKAGAESRLRRRPNRSFTEVRKPKRISGSEPRLSIRPMTQPSKSTPTICRSAHRDWSCGPSPRRMPTTGKLPPAASEAEAFRSFRFRLNWNWNRNRNTRMRRISIIRCKRSPEWPVSSTTSIAIPMLFRSIFTPSGCPRLSLLPLYLKRFSCRPHIRKMPKSIQQVHYSTTESQSKPIASAFHQKKINTKSAWYSDSM